MEKIGKIVTIQEVKQNPFIRAYVDGGNETTAALGYTDHGVRHASIVSAISATFFRGSAIQVGSRSWCYYDYVHDMGNVLVLPCSGWGSPSRIILSSMGMERQSVSSWVP